MGLDINGTHQVPAYADDVNLIGNIRIIERNSDVLLNVCEDIGLAVRIGKTWKEDTRIGSNSYEKVKTLKYLGSLLTNQNSTPEEIKCRLKARHSCYYSIQQLLSSF